MERLVTMRPATIDDLQFAFDVKKRAMWIFPPVHDEWDDAEQFEKVREKFKEPWLQIILYEGRSVGTVGLVDQGNTFRISQFFIEPEFHNKGIGKIVLNRLLANADADGRDTLVRVGIHQHSAIAFYEKLGFVDTEVPVDSDNCRLFRRKNPNL